jgi:hypothetical protein
MLFSDGAAVDAGLDELLQLHRKRVATRAASTEVFIFASNSGGFSTALLIQQAIEGS